MKITVVDILKMSKESEAYPYFRWLSKFMIYRLLSNVDSWLYLVRVYFFYSEPRKWIFDYRF